MMRLQSVRRSLAVVAAGAALLFGIVPAGAVDTSSAGQVSVHGLEDIPRHPVAVMIPLYNKPMSDVTDINLQAPNKQFFERGHYVDGKFVEFPEFDVQGRRHEVYKTSTNNGKPGGFTVHHFGMFTDENGVEHPLDAHVTVYRGLRCYVDFIHMKDHDDRLDTINFGCNSDRFTEMLFGILPPSNSQIVVRLSSPENLPLPQTVSMGLKNIGRYQMTGVLSSKGHVAVYTPSSRKTEVRDQASLIGEYGQPVYSGQGVAYLSNTHEPGSEQFSDVKAGASFSSLTSVLAADVPSEFALTTVHQLVDPEYPSYNEEFAYRYLPSEFSFDTPIGATSVQVTYDPNGASGSSFNRLYTRNRDKYNDPTVEQNHFTVEKNPYSRPGYQFVGWNTKKDGSGLMVNSDLVLPDSNITVYAQWKKSVPMVDLTPAHPTSHTVSFDSEGGAPVDPVHADYGQKVTLPVPSRPGFQFMGWFTTPDGKGERLSELTLTTDTTVYASWKKAIPITDLTPAHKTERNILFRSNDPQDVVITVHAVDGDSISTQVGLTRQGYRLVGWADHEGSAVVSVPVDSRLMVDGDRTLYAVWEQNTALDKPSSKKPVIPSRPRVVSEAPHEGELAHTGSDAAKILILSAVVLIALGVLMVNVSLWDYRHSRKVRHDGD